MVYVLRIQLFGPRAKGLVPDHVKGSTHNEDMLDSQLSILQLPKPNRIKAISQSGFLLCYYDDDVRTAATWFIPCVSDAL